MADLLPIDQPPSTTPRSRPRLVWYTQELGRYLPGRSGLATQRCLKYSPPQFVRAQVGVSSLAVTSQCCSSCATPMRSGPRCHTAARQTFPSVLALVNILFHSGNRWVTVRREARRQAQCCICWYATTQETLNLAPSCRRKFLAASSVDRQVGQEIDVWQHTIRSQSRRLPYERCRSVPPGRQVAKLSRLETGPD